MPENYKQYNSKIMVVIGFWFLFLLQDKYLKILLSRKTSNLCLLKNSTSSPNAEGNYR